jgi:hypothetical protein
MDLLLELRFLSVVCKVPRSRESLRLRFWVPVLG